MKKKIILLIIIINIIVASTGLVNLQKIANEITDSKNEVITTAFSPEQSEMLESSSGWFSGESVRVKYDSTTKYPSELYSQYPNPFLPSVTMGGDLTRLYHTDNNYHFLECDYRDDCSNYYPTDPNDFTGGLGVVYDTAQVSYDYLIDAKTSGTLYAEGFARYYYNALSISTTETTKSLSLDEDYISTSGRLQIKICAFAFDWYYLTSYFPAIIYIVFAYDFSTNTWTDVYSEVNAAALPTNPTFVKLQLYIDKCYFEPTDQYETIRSEYQYTSDTVVTHRMTVSNFDYQTEITIYKPVSWEYSSISFDCSISEGTNLVLTDTVPVDYTIFFTSTHNYLLTLEDISKNFLTDIGFEKGTTTDVILTDMFTLNQEVSTAISSEGIYSLYLNDDDVSTDNIPFSISELGNYYIAFDYYQISSTYVDIRIYTRNALDSWEYQIIDLGDLDRWTKVFAYVELLEFDEANFNRNLIIQLYSGMGETYFDNFRIFQVATNIETIDLDEYLISSTFISWDNYQNPTIENEAISFDLLERSSQTLIDSYSTTTNTNGIATWLYENSLEEKEYQINVFSNNSFWSPTPFINDIYNVASWSCWAGQSVISESVISDGQKTQTIQTQIDNNVANFVIPKYDPNEDFSKSDIYSFKIKVSEITDLNRIDVVFRQSGSNQIIWKIWDYQITANNYYQFFFKTYDCAYVHNDYTGQVSEFMPQYILDSSMDKTINFHFAEIKTLQTQKFFFTPSYSYNVDFAEEELLDEWDFSEGDTEGYNAFAYASAGGVENGYHITEHTSDASSYFSVYSTDGLSIDTDYYTQAIIRLRLDNLEAGALWRWVLVFYTPGYDEQGTTYALTESWQTFTINLESGKTAVRVRLYVYEENSNMTTDVDLHTDFIRLVHEEEIETYYSSTFLGIGSENDAWISAVYSDDVFLGFYNDPNIIPLNLTNGYHNISWLPVARQQEQKAFIYNNLHTYTYLVSEPANYYIILNPPSFDIAAGLLYVDIVTYWENCTVRIKMNDTWLGAAVPEGSSVWSFDSSSAGFYNFSCYIYNGLEVWDLLTTSITIPDPTIEIFTVHFDLVTPTGIGLSFETAKVYVNNSRIYSSEQYYFENAILAISVRDFFNNLLYSTIIQVTDNLDLSLPLDLIGQHVVNNYDVAVNVTLISAADGNYTHSYIMAAKSSITILIYTNSYHILVEPLLEEFYNGTHIITYFATSSSYQDLGYEPSTYEITMDTELEQLNFVEPEEAHRAVVIAFILSAVLNAGLIAMIGAFIKWGFVKVWNVLFKYPNVAFNWLLALFGVRPVSLMLEHKGGIEFVTPEEHQDIEKKKKEGFM